ncbi:hypothetical protein EI546_02310 [Aequorivita sp. H23M31]|uniref:Uncharacterized protein n=1 Tax=Aequorivita ciconiae TaxID=2494375 RepID=A0A410G071_9FLAO|nr:hypothetical protein [Aequorivita sp. H23M31]QAA80631.1 hypothetical protein EI546_02310 [Aequorivita sp. H23M31]
MKIFKTFIWLCISIISITGFSQECIYIKNQIDEVSKKPILQTKLEDLSFGTGKNETVRVQGYKENNRRYLEVWLVLTDTFTIEKDGEFVLFTDDGVPITLHFEETKTAENLKFPTPTTWALHTLIPLNLKDYGFLKSHMFTKLSYRTSAGIIEHIIKPKRQENITKVIQCI